MGKIFVLMGKSASGKDAIYKILLDDPRLNLKPYVGYTTRPRREGEENGREYYFVDADELRRIEESGRLIEKRTYHTVYGDWHYFSVADPGLNTDADNYLYIGTLESFVPLRDYYGKEVVIPVYIQVEDGERLLRAIARERQQADPRYAEMCRRFLTDSEDFSEEKIAAAGIEKRFENTDLDDCVQEIRNYMISSDAFEVK